MNANGIIVIPAYKPDKALLQLVKDLSHSYHNILIVDDGSGPAFFSIFEEAEAIPSVTIIHNTINKGKGYALKTAFQYIINDMKSADYVITADADGQHTPDAIARLAAAYTGKHEVILGKRTFTQTSDGRSVPLRSRLGNACTTAVFRFVCGMAISDTQTGLRLLPVSILQDLIYVSGEHYEYETNCLLWCKKNNITFHEVEIETIYEEGNKSSHFNPFLDSLRIYKVIFAYSFSSLLSVLIDYLIFFICTSAGCHVLIATYLARACSCLFNFTANRSLVFQSKGKYITQLIKYLLLVLVSGTVSGVTVHVLHTIIGCNLLVSKVLTESLLYFFNFYMQRKFVFQKTANP